MAAEDMTGGLPSAAVPLEPSTLLLTDRVCVVTGAAQGIGRATALALGRFGANLAVCDRDVDGLDTLASELEGLGRGVVAAELDVRDPEAVDGFFGVIGEQYGRVDVLVNNAGGGFQAPFLDVNAKGQDALVRENFGSVTLCIRAAVPLMGEGGSIVNITSIEAHRAGPGFAVYSAMKAAVASLTKSLALELGDRMIRVNCVAPDVIPTPALPEMPVHTPLPVRGEADDVAAAVVYLAGDGARFVTGSTVHVDGGNAAAAGWIRRDDGWRTS